MDIAKYIGQYLLKNSYCYIHGLGNLELVKRPAVHDGKALQAATYEVTVTAGGSIDDSFANFIAINEQISISKAANALRDFSMQARKDMAAGKEVVLPNLGRFLEENGKVKFITDPTFRYTPPGIPTIRNSKQLEEQKVVTPITTPPFDPPASANSVNWSMVILVVVLLLILLGGGYGYYYYTSTQKAAAAPAKDTVVTQQPVVTPPPPPAPDTTKKPDSTLQASAAQPATAVDSQQTATYQMVIGNYAARDKAEKRIRQLKINGNHVELFIRDSVNFMVLEEIKCRVVDTTHVKDSLGVMFGYKPVTIFKK